MDGSTVLVADGDGNLSWTYYAVGDPDEWLILVFDVGEDGFTTDVSQSGDTRAYNFATPGQRYKVRPADSGDNPVNPDSNEVTAT